MLCSNGSQLVQVGICTLKCFTSDHNDPKLLSPKFRLLGIKFNIKYNLLLFLPRWVEKQKTFLCTLVFRQVLQLGEIKTP